MSELSPSQIAKQWRVSKTTIYKHLNNGEMSYTTTEDGHKRIELSEVVRVLGEPKEVDDQKEFSSDSDISSMRRQIEKLEKDLEESKKDLEKSRDEKGREVEFLRKMIEGQSSQIAQQNQQITEALNGIRQLMIEHRPETEKDPVQESVVAVKPEQATPEPATSTEQKLEKSKKKRGLFTRLIAAAIED